MAGRVNHGQSSFQQLSTQIANVLLMLGTQLTTFVAPQNLCNNHATATTNLLTKRKNENPKTTKWNHAFFIRPPKTVTIAIFINDQNNLEKSHYNDTIQHR